MLIIKRDLHILSMRDILDNAQVTSNFKSISRFYVSL